MPFARLCEADKTIGDMRYELANVIAFEDATIVPGMDVLRKEGRQRGHNPLLNLWKKILFSSLGEI